MNVQGFENGDIGANLEPNISRSLVSRLFKVVSIIFLC